MSSTEHIGAYFAESAEAKRERRLQRRRKSPGRRASETAEQKEDKLSRRRMRDRAKRAAESQHKREALYSQAKLNPPISMQFTPQTTSSGSPHNV